MESLLNLIMFRYYSRQMHFLASVTHVLSVFLRLKYCPCGLQKVVKSPYKANVVELFVHVIMWFNSKKSSKDLKVHKHEIILNFFLTKIKSLYSLGKFSKKKFRFFSFDFRQNFEVRTFSRWLSIRGTKFFWRYIQIFFV